MLQSHTLYVLYAAFSGYVLLLLLAAVNDAAHYTIPNFTSIGLVLLFSATALLLPFKTAWLSHLGAASLVFVAGLLVYKFSLLGAGDVKLATAVSLWAGWEHLGFLLLYIALAGAVLAVGLVVLRRVLMTVLVYAPAGAMTAVPRLLQNGEHIPYGVAIAGGALYVAFELPHLLANL